MKMWTLSTPQEEILQFEMEEYCGYINNICELYEVQGTSSVEKLQAALNSIVKHEQALRLCFTLQDNKPYQYEIPYNKKTFTVYDWTELSETEKEMKCKAIAETPFELWNKELYSFTIVKIGEKLNVIFLVHHLIADGHSMGLLGKHLEDLLEGQEITSHLYTDFVEREKKLKQSQRYIRDREYWKEVFCDFEAPAMVSTKVIKNTEGYGARYEKELSSIEVEKINSFCTLHNCSPATPFSAALFVYMKRRNANKKTIEIGQMTLDRKGKGERETVGNYASELLLSVEINKSDSWKELMERINEASLKAFHHSSVLHDEIVEIVQEKRPQITQIRDLEFGYLPPIYNDGREYCGHWIANEAPEVAVECNLFNMLQTSKMQIVWDYQLTAMSESEAVKSVEEVLQLLLECVSNEEKGIEV